MSASGTLAPHQPRPARDAAHALERGGVATGEGRVHERAGAPQPNPTRWLIHQLGPIRVLQRASLRREASQLVPERLDPGHEGAVRGRPALAEIVFELSFEVVGRLVGGGELLLRFADFGAQTVQPSLFGHDTGLEILDRGVERPPGLLRGSTLPLGLGPPDLRARHAESASSRYHVA
jgi:hypothetical protein